jgi:multidrug transporter EmrE-like cation transporter
MEEKKDKPASIIDQLIEYLDTRFKLAKYQAADSGASFVASVVTDVVIILCGVLAFLFASLTLAYFLGDILHATWKGFGIVGILYIIIAIVVNYKRQSIEKPVVNALIKKIFKGK